MPYILLVIICVVLTLYVANRKIHDVLSEPEPKKSLVGCCPYCGKYEVRLYNYSNGKVRIHCDACGHNLNNLDECLYRLDENGKAIDPINHPAPELVKTVGICNRCMNDVWERTYKGNTAYICERCGQRYQSVDKLKVIFDENGNQMDNPNYQKT